MAVAVQRARRTAAENRELRELGAGERNEQLDAVHAAVGPDVVASLSKLWGAMKGDEDRMAASLDTESRRELLLLLRSLGEGNNGPDDVVRAEDLQRAEHFLLRAFPDKETQELLLAAARAGVAYSQLDGKGTADGATEAAKPGSSTGFLPG